MQTAQAQAPTQEMNCFHFVALAFALAHFTRVNRGNARQIHRHRSPSWKRLPLRLHILTFLAFAFEVWTSLAFAFVTAFTFASHVWTRLTFFYTNQNSRFNGVCFYACTGANYLYLPRLLIDSLCCSRWLWLVGVINLVLALFTAFKFKIAL